MTQEELDRVLDAHEEVLKNTPNAELVIENENLSNLDFSHRNLPNITMRNVDLQWTNFYLTDLSGSTLTNCDFSCANFYLTDLENTNLINSNLFEARIESVNFHLANLSGVIGLLNPIEFLKHNFKQTDEGYIVYKKFGVFHDIPSYWRIEPGAIITENVDYDRTNDCSYGINVSTYKKAKFLPSDKWISIYKLLIRWEWLSDVVVPYNATDSFRCGRAEILEEVK